MVRVRRELDRRDRGHLVEGRIAGERPLRGRGRPGREHLVGAVVPPIALRATTGESIDLASLSGRTVLFCYPRTGRPDEELPPGRQFLRPYFGMHRFEWDGTGGVEFHLGYGDWIRLLRAQGFTVENLIEIEAPAEAKSDELLDMIEWLGEVVRQVVDPHLHPVCGPKGGRSLLRSSG